MRIICSWMVVLSASILVAGADKPAKPLNRRTDPGDDFVASLDLKEAEIQSIDGNRVTLRVDGQDQVERLNSRSLFLIDEWRVTTSKVTFGDKSTLRIGDTVRAARVGKSTYLVRSRSVERERRPRLLYAFDKPESEKQWSIRAGVKDHDWEFHLTSDRSLEFIGTVTKETRHSDLLITQKQDESLGLNPGDAIVARVRGDGRTYELCLFDKVPRYTSFHYRSTFATKKDEWTEVNFPLSAFEGSSAPVSKTGTRVLRGGAVPDTDGLWQLGFKCDHQPGPFRLEIEWIKVVEAAEKE